MFTSLLRSLLPLLVLALAAPVVAAPKGVRNFDKGSWVQMKRDLPRPSVVVFTTTDCAYCPDVIEALAKDVKRGPNKANLVIVVMDGAEQPKAMMADRHYRKADAMYAFDGQGAALRYSVNPDWRGVTPYVVLLGREVEPVYAVGRPSAADLTSLLARP